MRRGLPPLRPRCLYLVVRGPFPFPLFLPLPLFALEWALLLLLFLRRAPLGPHPRPLGPLLWGVFTLRLLPPLPLVEVRAGEVEVRLGLL
ncbi:hypothetical protein [Thermus thermamylovorans]|uniref:Uncharacterized protein n=1 Tax=Thermus thermamylovorans TaxID=2509362 RepID=A0A4Q9AZM8_9DEIN|nr:hypothetical protein [Thermus thermamylovorans]TBH17640.1 hypothetical protein ETP66_08645 [Thermus thermamylovorans]